MLVVFGLALLVLAAAVVVLFAMLGELASRVAQAGQAPEAPMVRPLDAALVGRAPEVWPAALPSAQRCILVVLSTACSSCEDIARQLSQGYGDGGWDEFGIVLSTGGPQSGEQFVMNHSLQRLPLFVDEGGAWVSGEFGVRVSPAALAIRAGRLESAYMFNDVAALRAAVHEEWQSQEKEAAV